MSKAKFEAARQLITEKKYSEARAVLKTINHPTARQWESRLKKLETGKGAAVKKTKPAPRRRIMPILVVGVAVLCVITYLIGSSPEVQKSFHVTQTAQSVAQAATNDAQRSINKLSTSTAVARATLVTYTPSPTITPSATITNTPIPSETFTPAPLPTDAPAVTPLSARTYYVSRTANLRACPDTKCDSTGQLSTGDAIILTGVVIQGAVVNDSPVWYRITYLGQDVYIHSTLIQSDPPVLAVTAPSVSPIVQPPPTVSNVATCPGFQYTCQQLTCAQAYACLAAGNQQLDGNKDGIPCNAQCG